jgi:hypothetical protein
MKLAKWTVGPVICLVFGNKAKALEAQVDMVLSISATPIRLATRVRQLTA